MTAHKTRQEQFRVSGDAVVAQVRHLLHEGNVRHLVVRESDGRTLVELPLTLGALGVWLVPVWVAIGAVTALVADCTIEVERRMN